MFVLFLCSACSLLALIPIGGAVSRVSYTAIFFMMVTVSVILEPILNKKIVIPLLVASLYFYGGHLRYLIPNIETARQREAIYDQLKENEEELIVLPKYRFSTHGNFTNEDSWEHYMFKVYYEITDKTVIFE